MADELANIYRDTLKKYYWKSLEDCADVKNQTAGRLENILFQAIDVTYSMTKKDPIYKLIVIDPTLGPNDAYPCNFFVHDREMPDIETGSIVFLKNAVIREFQGKPQITKNGFTECVLFNKETSYYTSAGFQKEDGDEEIYAAFYNWSQARFNLNSSYPMTSNKRPFLTTAEIPVNDHKYFNYVGMIVGFFEKRGNQCQIKLTDYTKNPRPLIRTNDLVDDGTIGNITNEMTLSCTLFDEHANCERLKFGDFVFLDNCTRNKTNALHLEIRVSFTPEDKQHVTKLDPEDPRWQQLLRPLMQRKAEYDAPFSQSASQILETASYPMRSKIPAQQTLISIKQLLEKEEPGVEYIRATIEKQKPTDLTAWLKNYCSYCRITSVPTVYDMFDVCGRCGSLMNPVYRAMFKVRDESGSELAVLAMDEEADRLFKGFPAHMLKCDSALWGKFRQCIKYTQAASNGQKPHFNLGVRKYFSSNNIMDGWMYCIVNTEFVIEDDSQW